MVHFHAIGCLVFNAGAANRKMKFQSVVEGTDTLGAPVQTWTDYMTVHASIEGEESTVSDSLTTGPRREALKTMTVSIRNHPSFTFNTRQRVIDVRTNEVYSITGIRYNAKRSICFIDLVGGGSKGA